MSAQAHYFLARHRSKPLAVVAHLRLVPVEDLVDLFKIRLRVGVNLFAVERRSRFGLAAGIANHRGEIANKKDCRVSQVLKVLEFAQNHRVSQMDIGRRRIHTKLYAQRLAGRGGFLDLRFQLILTNDFGDALVKIRKLLVNWLEFGGRQSVLLR